VLVIPHFQDFFKFSFPPWRTNSMRHLLEEDRSSYPNCSASRVGTLALYLTFFCIIIYSDLVHCFVFKTVCVTHHQAACVTRDISSSCPPWCSDLSSCSAERIASSLIEWLIGWLILGYLATTFQLPWFYSTECYGYCIRDLARPLKDTVYTDCKVWCQHFFGRTGDLHENFSQANRSPNQCSISKPPRTRAHRNDM